MTPSLRSILVLFCFLLASNGLPLQFTEASAQTTSRLFLDVHADATTAYGVRLLRSNYTGPLVRIKRSNDGAERDFAGTSDGQLNVPDIETWLGNANGTVVRWYNQVANGPHLSGEASIAREGRVHRDDGGRPVIKFAAEDKLSATGYNIRVNDVSAYVVQNTNGSTASGNKTLFDIGSSKLRLYAIETDRYWVNGRNKTGTTGDNTRFSIPWDEPNTIVVRSGSDGIRIYKNDAKIVSQANSVLVDDLATSLTIGGGFQGYVAEFVIFPALDDSGIWSRFDYVNDQWRTGPVGVHRKALLPQEFTYQVTLYDWLESVAVDDIVLPAPTFGEDLSVDDDELADIWLQVEGASASSVVRGAPEWYVLDAGDGRGIEATGEVRFWNEPRGGSFGGNPPRSWANEPAFLYQLSLPLSNGGEGNPYYQHPAMGKRAMVVAIVDMMMYHRALLSGQAFPTWQDMYGKAMLGWGEAYRWAGNVLDAETRKAYEEGLGHFLDHMIEDGPRAVNTNMDMFAVHAAGEIYMAADSPQLKEKAVQAVKRTLFGYPDGELGVKHKVFRTGGGGHDGGVFDPSGFIMEGDQPDIFYGGESLYQVTGALAAVTDRATGAVPSDWHFLVEVVRRLQEWRTYQYFYEPGTFVSFHAGAGFSGRTGGGVPAAQAAELYTFAVLADRFEEARFLLRNDRTEVSNLPSRSQMLSTVHQRLTELASTLSNVYSSDPPVWNGWSPWTKKTPYLPPKGWYSRLRPLLDANDVTTFAPVRQRGHTYNKLFGGYPVGLQYWAHKKSDGEREWGFFVEAQGRQGGYNGWYGGKIETFWTESTGVVILNRHGKAGCDGKKEDSTCWENLEYRAGHHVWGRDESGHAFTTLLLRGHNLLRAASVDNERNPSRLIIDNRFNDPSHDLNPAQSETGEQTGKELTGVFNVVNSFEVLSDGVEVTHSVESDQSDELRELWASLPVFLRLFQYQNHPGDKIQKHLEDTSIEYWNGNQWKRMPEDEDGDGVPEMISTTSLRLGRDFLLGDGPQYVYVKMEGTQHVRLSTQAYEDPYQTMARVRTVHIDLHGSPGIVRTMPATKSLTYTIQTTDPTVDNGGDTNSLRQEITLTPGWNLVSRYVNPPDVTFAKVIGEQCASLEMVKDDSGQVYAPKIGLKSLVTWEATEAYSVHVSDSCTIVLEGPAVDPSSVALTAGWNLVPYPLAVETPITEALESISTELSQVRDGQGNLYTPGSKNNPIGTLKPGQGYEVFVQRNVDLTY